MNRRTFVKLAGFSTLGLIANMVKAEEKKMSVLFLSPNVLENNSKEVDLYFKEKGSSIDMIKMMFWNAFKEYDPRRIDFHGGESDFYRNDFNDDLLTKRLLREKYNWAFFPELNLKKYGLDCFIHSCEIVDPCYSVAKCACVYDSPFWVYRQKEVFKRSLKKRTTFDIEEVSSDRFWTDMLNLMYHDSEFKV